MSFLDLETTPSSSGRVLPTETEESDWLRVILTPRPASSLESQVVCSWRESSDTPLRFISTTEATMEGPETTRFWLRVCTTLAPSASIFFAKIPSDPASHCFTEISSQNSRWMRPQFSLMTSADLSTRERLSLTLASPIISQVKLWPSSTFSQLMVTGRMKASGRRPSATFWAMVPSMPYLGGSILPVRLRVPSMKNSRQWLPTISFERYSLRIALQSWRCFFWLRLMKKAPERRSRIWTTAIPRKSSAAAMCGQRIPLPKKMQLTMRKSTQLRWVGMITRGPLLSEWAWMRWMADLSTTTFSQMVVKILCRNQANTRIDPIEQSLNIVTQISSATRRTSSSACSYDPDLLSSRTISSSAAPRIASFTARLWSTNCTASRRVCPGTSLPCRRAHVMSEKQLSVRSPSRSIDSGWNCSTCWWSTCFLIAKTHSLTQTFQGMWLTLKSQRTCSEGLRLLKRSMVLIDSHSHSLQRKYRYFERVACRCCSSCDCRCPSIFHETTPSTAPSLFFTSEGSFSAWCLIFWPRTVWTMLIWAGFSPQSCQAWRLMSTNCQRVMQWRVEVERLTVSTLAAVSRAASTSSKLLAQSVGTTSILLLRTPSTLRILPSPTSHTKQPKFLGECEQAPSQLPRVGPSAGTRTTTSVELKAKQHFYTQEMLHFQASSGELKLSLRQARASCLEENWGWMEAVSSSSSSSPTYPGSRRQMLDSSRHFPTFTRARAALTWLVRTRWWSATLSSLEKSPSSKVEKSRSRRPPISRSKCSGSCARGT